MIEGVHPESLYSQYIGPMPPPRIVRRLGAPEIATASLHQIHFVVQLSRHIVKIDTRVEGTDSRFSLVNVGWRIVQIWDVLIPMPNWAVHTSVSVEEREC